MPGAPRPRRIFLVGLSGSGKSTVGRLVAQQLGWDFADSDREVERRRGRTVAEIFAAEGEERFRRLEAEVLAELATREPIIVATGGGAITTEAGRRSLAAEFVVWLNVTPAEAARRLQADASTEERPLLAGGVEERLAELLGERAPRYAGADVELAVDGLDPDQVASLVVERWRALGAALANREAHEPAAVVRAPGGAYPVIVHDGALDRLGDVCREVGLRGRAFLLTDDNVGPLFSDRARASLERAGFAASAFAIPSGEEQKNLATVTRVYDWLLAARIERRDFVVCLGGGVVTDLGGFAAATILRGIAFVHVPTTLLGMVDASIGGKTGVDHPRGKNMIGAFAQPKAVAIDPAVLQALPPRQVRAGWAELIKHGLILDLSLLAELEVYLRQGNVLPTATLIGRSAAIKAEVVSEDEREEGRRTLLNYGHTIGHAIEAVTGYHDYLHGEAVAIGMRVAGQISVELRLLPASDFDRQQALLRAAGLPERAPGLSVDAVLDATLGDKKVSGGKIRWVLLEGLGHAVVRPGVPDGLVREAVARALAAPVVE